MKKKTITAKKKIAYYIDTEINLARIHESMPTTIDYRHDKNVNRFIRSSSYDAVDGIEVDKIVIDEETNQAAILFHIIATGEKLHYLSYWGYDGMDSRTYRGHEVIWNFTKIPDENTVKSREKIQGTMTDHFAWEPCDPDDPNKRDTFLDLNIRTTIIEEPCRIHDLNQFFQEILTIIDLNA